MSWDTGGLGVDIDIITQTLSASGFRVYFKGRKERHPQSVLQSKLATAKALLDQKWGAIVERPPFDINFFVESVFPDYLDSARLNCLFVNQEWFRESNLPLLSRIDYLLCKTRVGLECVRAFPVKSINVGFTSPDKRIPEIERPYLRCLHVAGQSALKGTDAVIEVWSRNPAWPELTVVRRDKRYGGGVAPELPKLPNVRYLTDFVSDEELRLLQNLCQVHVAPSEAEGYGHVIGEAMSCGAVVVTTDAPPMNELVTRDRGFLVGVKRSEPFYLSSKHFVDADALEQTLHTVFSMSDFERSQIGVRARGWFETQHDRFSENMRNFLSHALGDRSS